MRRSRFVAQNVYPRPRPPPQLPQDLGAHSALTLGRFGAAGARILRGAHRALDSAGSDSAPAAAVSDGFDSCASGGVEGESALLRAVAAIPLGPLPLYKSTLVVETLHALFVRHGFLQSIYLRNDGGGGAAVKAVGDDAPALGAATTPDPSRALCLQILEALSLLVYRLTVLDARGRVGGGRQRAGDAGAVDGVGVEVEPAAPRHRESFTSPVSRGAGGASVGSPSLERLQAAQFAGGPPLGGSSSVWRRRAARSFARTGDACAEETSAAAIAGANGASATGGNAAGSISLEDVVGTELLPVEEDCDEVGGVASATRFGVWVGDVEAAAEGHALRRLADLALADADAHVFASDRKSVV